MAAARIKRWSLILSACDYKQKYKFGDKNSNADCMSRLPVSSEQSSVLENYVLMMELSHSPVTAVEVRKHTARDTVLSQVVEMIEGKVSWDSNQVELKSYQRRRRYDLSNRNRCILWGSRVVIPPKLRADVLQELHTVHPRMCRMKALTRSLCGGRSLMKRFDRGQSEEMPCVSRKSS